MGGKIRINITIDPETVRLADREARLRKTSRSDFIRSAVRAAATQNRHEAEEAARRERQRRAAERMDALARKAGDWPAEEILHAWRYRLAGRNR